MGLNVTEIVNILKSIQTGLGTTSKGGRAGDYGFLYVFPIVVLAYGISLAIHRCMLSVALV